MASENKIRYCQQCTYIIADDVSVCPKCNQPVTYKDFNIFLGKKFHKYEITEIIGRGGMGVVFKAQHEMLGNIVALKMILPSELSDIIIKRFQREARILAKMNHPNIVSIHDADTNEYGFPYYVMEHLEGISLRALLKSRLNPLTRDYACMIIRQFLNGLAYAHQNKIVHRDLKPENIFLSKDIEGSERIKILDFGIAKRFAKESGDSSASGSLTIDGYSFGTPLYMSVEQILGREIDPRTDVYSTGLIIYEILTNTPAIIGESMSEVVFAHLNELPAEKVKEIPGVSESVKEFLRNCLRRDADLRFQNAIEMKEAFEEILEEKHAFSAGADEAEQLCDPVDKLENIPVKSKVMVPRAVEETPSSAHLKTPLPSTDTKAYLQQDSASGTRVTKVAPRSVLKFRNIIIALSLIVLLLASYILFIRKGETLSIPNSGDNLQQIGQPLQPPLIKTSGTIELAAKYPMPSDAANLIAELELNNNWIIEGYNKYYLFNSANKQVLQAISILPGYIFLGVKTKTVSDREGVNLYWLFGNKVLLTDANHSELKNYAVGDETWQGGWYDDNNGYMFLYSSSKLNTYIFENDALHLLCTYKLSSTLQSKTSNDHYVALAMNEMLQVFGVRECDFTRDIPVQQNVVRKLALHEKEDWIAIGGDFDKVIIYDFAKMDIIYEPDLKDSTQSLIFLKEKPALLILKKSALYQCDVDENQCRSELQYTSRISMFLALTLLKESGKFYLLTREPTELVQIKLPTP
ncbi:MAG: hypothetical protein A2Y62_17370 [Candidatus Fischerbacteria bacterium RBG_13_37_8]|uniref:Protein kinase domain-containing protein n=1 Tax=Candidatus Fischerbacteria bacterium RBG_13_37_8 TaxID=1817863 RepID=A0A1F5VN49_9BACT|nr:MAG: hypothetical protein A2Y62_17370 [Candidatus Fischerbacteria bacterium RBG_13_37_8]